VINLKKNSLSDYSDIRNSQRIIQSNMSCRFDNNATLFPIHELSAHGFSFLCPTKLCFFRQGAIFNKLSILNIDKMEIISAAGTVVHTSQFDLKNMRVGVLFHKKQHDYQIDKKIRVFRHIPPVPLNIEIQIQKKQKGRSILGKILDFTATSARITLDDPQEVVNILKQETTSVKIYANDYIFFTGPATTLKKQEKDGEIILKFTQQPLDVLKIEEVLKVKENSLAIIDLINSVPTKKDFRDDFKALICDWQNYFTKCKQILDMEEDKQIYQSDEEKKLLIKEISDGFLPPLHTFVDRLNVIADQIEEKESLSYKKYFRENLDSYFRNSKIVSSTIDKFHGYSGDFITIKHFFQSPDRGDSLFAKFINTFVFSLDAVKAHRERIDFIYKEIQTAYKKAEKKLSILILGSGPAEELLRFLKENQLTKPVQATLIDFDAYALTDFSDRLQYIPKEMFDVRLINIDILSILKSGVADTIKEKYQLTYCAGLLDYFSQTICKRMVKYMIGHTEPNGQLIITNVHKKNATRRFMDYVLRWQIFHRDEKQMEQLIPPGHKGQFFYDSLQTNIFQKIYMSHQK